MRLRAASTSPRSTGPSPTATLAHMSQQPIRSAGAVIGNVLEDHSDLTGWFALLIGWNHFEEAGSAVRETVCPDCSERTSGKRRPHAPQKLRWHWTLCVFVTLLFRRLTASHCSYAAMTRFPHISSIVSDMLLYQFDVFNFYCTLQLLCTRLLLPVSEISVTFSNTWKLFQELISGQSTWESSLQVSFTQSSGLWMGSIFTSEVPTWTGGPSHRYTHIQEVDLHILTWLYWY